MPDSDLIIEKDVNVVMPLYQIHHDPEFYENPEKFDPDRFAPGKKENIPSFTYMPFGDGPRICIGNFTSDSPI